MVSHPTHLSNMFLKELTYMGFYEASGIGAVVVLTKPTKLGTHIVWRHPWTYGITATLILVTNTGRTLTTSNLDLIALVVHKATLLAAVP